MGEEEGTIEEQEHEMLYRVFRFSDTITREVMTPRTDVVMIDVEDPLEDSFHQYLQ